MITLILTLIAIGFLLISATYRHALLFAKSGILRLIWIAFVFTALSTLMGWVAILFASSVRDNMYFGGAYAALLLLLVLASKAYFGTRRSKIAENIFDITSFRMLFFLAFSSSFEVFIAMTGTMMIECNENWALALLAAFSFFFSLLGLLAGRRPSIIKSIKIFIFLASVFYLFAALSSIYYLL